MAKKKNISKKHKFKNVDSASLEPVVSASVNESGSDVSGAKRADVLKTAPAAVGTGRDFSYVTSDLRRIALLGGSLVVIELVLYYILVHTAFGATVYSLVRI